MMYNLGLDYVTQLGILAVLLLLCAAFVVVWHRLLAPIIERVGMVERVKMALYDKELEKFCKENNVDYSKIDIKFVVCYKKKHGKLKARLEEIENELF